MMFAKEAEALAFAEPLVPKRYHTWLRVLPQWKNEKLPNSNRDNWVQCFCPYFTTEGLLRQAWDDARHVGLSEVGVDEIKRAQSVVEIATVQNIYNLVYRKHDDVLAYCTQNNIGFIPFWPLHAGALAKSEAMAEIVARTGATPAQVALAWLLRKSPVIILIPGTSSIEHLEQNVAACDVHISDADMEALERLAAKAAG